MLILAEAQVSFTQHVVDALQPLVLALVAWAAKAAADWLRSKAHNEQAANVISRVTDAVATAVREVEQTIAAELRLAAADGHISAEEREQIKRAAIAAAKKHLGEAGVKLLVSHLGLKSEADIDQHLAGRIEAEVLLMKSAR